MPRSIWYVAGALVVGAVLLAEPLGALVGGAVRLQQTYGLGVVPAVFMLLLLLLFAERARRTDAAARTLTRFNQIARHAVEVDARREALASLLKLNEELSAARTANALRQVVARELPRITAGQSIWLAARLEGWQVLFGHPDPMPRAEATPPLLPRGTWVSYPLVSGRRTIGVLAIGHEGAPPTDAQRESFRMLASILATAVKNVQLFTHITALASTDALTGCATKRHGLETLGREIRRMRRTDLPLSIVLLDIDNFKTLNDTHGHAVGDRALAIVGRLLGEMLRASDIRCRYGGEEFLLVLPDASQEGAGRAAENLRRAIAARTVPAPAGDAWISASFGVTRVQIVDSVETALARADEALYEAKRQGRNRVVLA